MQKKRRYAITMASFLLHLTLYLTSLCLANEAYLRYRSVIASPSDQQLIVACIYKTFVLELLIAKKEHASLFLKR